MNIYKLKYTDRETAISDLISKQVINETNEHTNGTQAVVDIGLIVLEQGIYDDDWNEISSPIYAEGYHFDIMTRDEISFESMITPNNPKHTFAGY